MNQYLPLIIYTIINFYWVHRAIISKNISSDNRTIYYILAVIPLIGSFTLFYVLTLTDPKIEELEKRITALENINKDL